MDGTSQNRSFWKRNKIFRILVCVFLSLILLALAFVGGIAVGSRISSSEVRTLSWVKDMVRTYYYQDIPEETLANANMNDLFHSDTDKRILDQYSAYYTAQEYQSVSSSRAGNQVGIGLSFLSTSSGMQIYKVSGNSPAEKSGLKAGMYLLSYGLNQENLTPFVYSNFSAFTQTLESGDSFVLEVTTSLGGVGEYYTVQTVSTYSQNYVFYSDSERAYSFTGKNADELTQGETQLSFLPQDAACIRLDSFNGKAAQQFEDALEIFKEREKNHLILDLRNNGGGQLTVLSEIAEYLCDTDFDNFPVVNIRYKGDEKKVYVADESRYDDYFSANTQITVLANVNTASASEALIGAMLDYGTIDYTDIYLAEINGKARTYGKGIMQTTYQNVLTGEAIKLTTATIRWPLSDVCIQGRGILPEDGAVAVSATGYVEYNDDMLRQIVTDYFA